MTNQLYHGMTDTQFQEHYKDGSQIPNNWTTGPIQAIFFAYSYHLSDMSDMLIWVIPQWDNVHFRKVAEKMDKPIAGIVDAPSPDWYSCILNPFDSQQEREQGVKLYQESDLERYILLYVKEEKQKRKLLEWVKLKNAD